MISDLSTDKVIGLSIVFCTELVLEAKMFAISFWANAKFLGPKFDPFRTGGKILYRHRYFAVIIVCFAFPTIFTLAEYYKIVML
jgi:hypothetical protein